VCRQFGGLYEQAALAALTFVAIYGQEFEVASIRPSPQQSSPRIRVQRYFHSWWKGHERELDEPTAQEGAQFERIALAQGAPGRWSGMASTDCLTFVAATGANAR
jgi:hypothetical protein